MSTRPAERPADCAMAFAPPLSRWAFMRDLRRYDGRDLPRQRLLEVPGSTRAEAWQYYKPAVRTGVRVIRRVKRLGVTVLTDVKASDLRTLLCRYRVVTFFSHYPYLSVAPEDIADVPRMKQHLTEDTELRPRNPAEQLRFDVATLWQDRARGQAATGERMAAFLDYLIRDSADVWARGTPKTSGAGGDTRGRILLVTRLDLEMAYNGTIIPKSVVDFADGARPVRDLLEAIPCGFDGTLDLITCHSVVAGEQIRLTRECGPNAVIPTAVGPVDLQYVLSFYRSCIELLRFEQMDYLTAMSRVRELCVGSREEV